MTGASSAWSTSWTSSLASSGDFASRNADLAIPVICSANTDVARTLKAADVSDVLSDLFILRGASAHIRSDNGPEFVVKQV